MNLKTYLSPITSNVRDFSTIQKYLKNIQKLAYEANMPYVIFFLDVEAAIKAFKFFWNIPKKFQKVVIYLGNIHFLKENFGVI